MKNSEIYRVSKIKLFEVMNFYSCITRIHPDKTVDLNLNIAIFTVLTIFYFFRCYYNKSRMILFTHIFAILTVNNDAKKKKKL